MDTDADNLDLDICYQGHIMTMSDLQKVLDSDQFIQKLLTNIV